MNTSIVIIIETAMLIAAALYYLAVQKSRAKMEVREKETRRKMYELSILKELGDRIGYSLDVTQIADIITGSLHQFIAYSVVSSIILGPERIIFKAHLERSVSRRFMEDVKERMMRSLSALLDKDLQGGPVE